MEQTIVVPVDGELLSERALSFAVPLARTSGHPILLFRSIATPSAIRLSEDPWHDPFEAAARELTERAAELQQAGIPAEFYLTTEPPDRALVEYVGTHPTACIVMAIHGRAGITRSSLPSVSDALMRSVNVPLVLIPSSSGTTWARLDEEANRRIVLALDGSPLAEAAIPPAMALARMLNASIMLLHIQKESDQQEKTARLDAVAARIRTHDIPVELRVATGFAPAAIAAATHEPGVVATAMATHGETGLTGTPLASNAALAISNISVPLLIVRPPAPASLSAEPVPALLATA